MKNYNKTKIETPKLEIIKINTISTVTNIPKAISNTKKINKTDLITHSSKPENKLPNKTSPKSKLPTKNSALKNNTTKNKVIKQNKKKLSKSNTKQNDFLETLMKSLEQNSISKENNKKKQISSNNNNEDLSKKLSITQIQYIQNIINQNWDRGFLSGSKNSETINITIEVSLDKNGILKNEPQIIKLDCGLASNEICRATKVSVIRAIIKSSPITGLNIEDYDSWRDLTLVFNPAN